MFKINFKNDEGHVQYFYRIFSEWIDRDPVCWVTGIIVIFNWNKNNRCKMSPQMQLQG